MSLHEHGDRPAARLAAAAICILYGFAKLNGSQFTVLDSELTRPMGDVSGFWLTWHYFGYSKVYGTLVALIQVAGGLLLIWPRTALLGAVVLFPVAANILLIDIFYGIDLGGTAMAMLLLILLAAVIAPHAGRLRAALLPARDGRRDGRAMSIGRVATAALFIGGAFAFTFWAAHYNNRAPTAIDGVWRVVSDTQQPARWTRVFFERNRAHMAILRAPDGTDARHHFEIANGEIRVRERWLDRSSREVMSGQFDGDRRIRLGIAPDAGGGVIELERVTRQ